MGDLLMLSQLWHIEQRRRQSQRVLERFGFPWSLIGPSLVAVESHGNFKYFTMRHKRSPHTRLQMDRGQRTFPVITEAAS